jgi:hypothetical protein
VCTPDKWVEAKDHPRPPTCGGGWTYPQEHGNLTGWRQFRKMQPGEACRLMPEGLEP